MPRYPFGALPKFGYFSGLNLLALMAASQSALPTSYEATFLPLSQCSTWLPLATMRVWFHSLAGLRGVLGRRVEVVHRSREVVVLLVVGRVHVVEQLILRRAPVDLVELVGAAIEHAAVAGVADVPLELELEIAELLLRRDVVGVAVLLQHAVRRSPSSLSRPVCRTSSAAVSVLKMRHAFMLLPSKSDFHGPPAVRRAESRRHGAATRSSASCRLGIPRPETADIADFPKHLAASVDPLSARRVEWRS